MKKDGIKKKIKAHQAWLSSGFEETQAVFQREDLSNINFLDFDASLRCTIYEFCDLGRTSFAGVFLSGSTFKNCRASLSRFHDTTAVSCTFSDMEFYETFFTRANLRESFFESCNLSSAILTQARLQNVEFINCDLIGAEMCEADLTQAKFVNSSLLYANFWKAKNLFLANLLPSSITPLIHLPSDISLDQFLESKVTFKKCYRSILQHMRMSENFTPFLLSLVKLYQVKSNTYSLRTS